MQRDPKAWIEAISSAAGEEKAARCREALKVFPAATEVWQQYLAGAAQAARKAASAARAKPGDEALKEKAEAAVSAAGELLLSALDASIDPKLYQLYLEHVREHRPQDLAQAFEFALERISCDPESGAIWKQFIDHLSSQQVSNEWEEQFRRDRVRKAYKRAVALPLVNVELLWKQYGQFEMRISRVSARKFIDERSGAYMKARTFMRTFQKIASEISFSTMPTVEQSMRAIAGWRQYLSFEMSNPLEFGVGNTELNDRVVFAFKRAVICARWAPPLWFDAGVALGFKFWEQGVEAMPESCLLALKLAEHYEQENDFESAEKCLRQLASARRANNQDETPAAAQLVRVTHRMRGAQAARAELAELLDKIANPTVQLYLAAASIESAEERHDAAAEILAFAFSKFVSAQLVLSRASFNFVLRYLQCLFAKNDVVNARAVFEQCVPKTPSTFLQELFEAMLALETQHCQNTDGGIAFLRRLERRCAEMFNLDESVIFARRFCDDESFAADIPILGGGPAAPGGPQNQQTSENAPPSDKISDYFPPESLFAVLASSLPPPEVYDGPLINVKMLVNFLAEIPIDAGGE